MTTPTDPHNYARFSALQLVGDTGAAGFTLINGTATILQWNVPNDGFQHVVIFGAVLNVTSLQTGGAVAFNTTLPNGTANNNTAMAGGLAAGVQKASAISNGVFPVQGGSTVTITQSSAQTAGASVLFAQIWGA